MRTYIMICASINAFLGSRAFASRQYARGCGYVLTAPAIWGRLRAYASARGGYCATHNTPPRARLLACAPYAALAPAMCSPPPRLGGGCAHTPPHRCAPAPVLRQICHPNSRFSELFATISPDAERDNRAQRTQFKEAPWDSISIEATRGLNLHYLARYNMSTNRVSSPT